MTFKIFTSLSSFSTFDDDDDDGENWDWPNTTPSLFSVANPNFPHRFPAAVRSTAALDLSLPEGL